MILALASCASHQESRSIAQYDDEETVSKPDIMVTSINPKMPIIIEADNKELGKIVEPNTSNILKETLVVGEDRFGRMAVTLSCNWPIQKAENSRSIKTKDRRIPLAITSYKVAYKNVQVGTKQETTGPFWNKTVVHSNVFLDKQFLTMGTNLNTSPEIVCQIIPDGEGIVAFDYDMGKWVEPSEVEKLFLKNGFIIHIPIDPIDETIE